MTAKLCRALSVFVVFGVCLLSAGLARAAITVTIVAPTPNQIAMGTLAVQATVVSTLQLQSVHAQVDASGVDLAFVNGKFSGNVPLAGVALGARTLTVTATDVMNATGAGQVTFQHAEPAVGSWIAPAVADGGWIVVRSGSLHIAATCPGCASLQITIPGTVLASGTTDIDQVIDLSAYTGQAVQLALSAKSPGNVTTNTPGPILFVEPSPSLTEVDAIDGLMLDFSADTILGVNLSSQPFLQDRATHVVTPIPLPKTFDFGGVTPLGALLVSVTDYMGQNGAPHLYDFRSGALIDLGIVDPVTVRLSGGFTAWVDQNGFVHQRDLIAGTTVNVGLGSACDVLSSGEVIYTRVVANKTQLASWNAGVSQGLTSAPVNHDGLPVADGINVAYIRFDALGNSTWLVGAGMAETSLGVVVAGFPQTASYALSNGFTAFLKQALGGVNQIWVRDPMGATTQISFFGNSSSIDDRVTNPSMFAAIPAVQTRAIRTGHDSVSDTGEVVFTQGGTRYLGGAGKPLVAVSTALGHARWFNGAWYVEMGNKLFAMCGACPAADDCHAPVCNAQTGICENLAKANGAVCNDGNACTQGDACQSGICMPGSGLACPAQDECHAAGACDPASGMCSSPLQPDGTPCTGGLCASGTCVPGGSGAGGGGATTGAGGSGGAMAGVGGGATTTAGAGGGATTTTTAGAGGGATTTTAGAGGGATTTTVGAGGAATTTVGAGGGATTTTTAGAGGGATTAAGTGGAGPTTVGATGTSGGGPEPQSFGGCGVAVAPSTGVPWATLGLLLALRRRRARKVAPGSTRA